MLGLPVDLQPTEHLEVGLEAATGPHVLNSVEQLRGVASGLLLQGEDGQWGTGT